MRFALRVSTSETSISSQRPHAAHNPKHISDKLQGMSQEPRVKLGRTPSRQVQGKRRFALGDVLLRSGPSSHLVQRSRRGWRHVVKRQRLLTHHTQKKWSGAATRIGNLSIRMSWSQLAQRHQYQPVSLESQAPDLAQQTCCKSQTFQTVDTPS